MRAATRAPIGALAERRERYPAGRCAHGSLVSLFRVASRRVQLHLLHPGTNRVRVRDEGAREKACEVIGAAESADGKNGSFLGFAEVADVLREASDLLPSLTLFALEVLCPFPSFETRIFRV